MTTRTAPQTHRHATQAGRAAYSGRDVLQATCLQGEAALTAYAALCRDCVFAPAQSAQWVACWARHCNADIVVATLSRRHRPVFAVALEVVAHGSAKMACLVGGTHANGNFSPVVPAAAADIGPGDIKTLIRSIRAARPDIDLLVFERLISVFRGSPNPLSRLGGAQSPNPALAVDLTGGFEAVLARASGKRKRKKHRSQTRKFEAAGGFRRLRAENRLESERLLDAFFAMKAERFATMGIKNVFDGTPVQDFFRELFGSEAHKAAPAFVLHGLEVGGLLRAVTGSSISADSVICEFGAIAGDELAFASPGEFLFFDNIREACEQGLAIYDFSVGDETYKRLWCDIETHHVDIVLPLTLKGRASALSRRTAALVKRRVKATPLLWEAVKRARRATRGSRET
ncbi:GNAT family N-acetyltransferase [Nitratireductor alexandrii]|uniref:GNAT family N-acetyltransferase n=1 Tax=Nitratireductor alexandrii TaxID=2448161 RepID=UPI001EE7C7A2|nr:GNAT family N-acetyltransferase [Nitratireductor alexandrii]